MTTFREFVTHIYAALIKLYPPRHRVEFADEMQRVFADALAEAGIRGSGSMLMLCGRELRDLPGVLVREYLREVGKKQTAMRAFYLLVLLALTLACWVAAVGWFGLNGLGFLIILVPLCVLWAPVVTPAVRRLGARVWIYAGLVILVTLSVVPTAVLGEFHQNLPVHLPHAVEYILSLTILFMPPAAVVVAALLFYSGLTLFDEWRNASQGRDNNSPARHRPAGRTAAIALVISLLLLGVMLYNLYWLMVWDSTTDALDFLWLIFPILAALFAGLLLAVALPRWTKLTGLAYALLIPALMIAVSVNAKSVDFRQLTQARAAQVSQAIESYYAREDRYPQDLHQLTPWDVLSLPGPVIIYGEDWCYDGGADYYRLGYVDREHWSSPNFTGHLYKAKGQAPELHPFCSVEIAGLQKRFQYPGQ